MTNPNNNLAAMREAGKSAASANVRAAAILKNACKAGVNEAYLAKLRYEFIVGAVMGACNLGDNAAIDYLPLLDAKPGQPGKWKDYPVSAPASFDPARHRPLDVHHAYRGALANWSNVRKAAGLPPLKVVKRAAQKTEGDMGGIGEPEPIVLASFAVPFD